MKSLGITFGKELRARIVAVIGNGISVYPIIAEETSAYPYIAYTREGLTLGRSKDGIHEESITYTLNIYTGNDYSRGLDIANTIIDTLTDWRYLNTDTQQQQRIDISIISSSETYVGDSYLQALSIEIRADRY